LAFILSVETAAAATIYSESVDGDLDAVGTTNVNLIAGVNTILGSINQTPPADTDRIKVTQAIGMTVDSIVLSFAAPFDDFNISQSMNAALFNSVANVFDDNFGQINSGASISASFFDSFGPETGPLSQDTGEAVWDFQLSAGIVAPAQPWTLEINTTQEPTSVIPLPAGGLLLLTGLGGFAAFKRRKKRAA